MTQPGIAHGSQLLGTPVDTLYHDMDASGRLESEKCRSLGNRNQPVLHVAFSDNQVELQERVGNPLRPGHLNQGLDPLLGLDDVSLGSAAEDLELDDGRVDGLLHRLAGEQFHHAIGASRLLCLGNLDHADIVGERPVLDKRRKALPSGNLNKMARLCLTPLDRFV